jgi:pullulanase
MSDLMARRADGFVLWRPARTAVAPRVEIVELTPGNPPTETLISSEALIQSSTFPDLWELPLAKVATKLTEGTVYHYWFVVDNDSPGSDHSAVRCTDPLARVVDYRLGDPMPAGVLQMLDGQLVDCDPDGTPSEKTELQSLADLAPNNQIVIYELPSSWTRVGSEGTLERDVGTFRDVLALLDPDESGANFGDVGAVSGRAHLLELGVNAIELLPPADSPFRREWGYGTGNYFAGDWDLGFPEINSSPTTEQDLRRLVNRMHELNIRFIADLVMAFGHTSYRSINFGDFHIVPADETTNPDSYQSDRANELRKDFSGKCWRYIKKDISGYDPVTGTTRSLVPARRFHIAHMLRWLEELGVDGLRLDSINNIASYDFLTEFKQATRDAWLARHPGGDSRFLVVGEELNVPFTLLPDQLDALWNEAFQPRLRSVILGQGLDNLSFDQTVREMIDCCALGFPDGARAINYITSHDVEGFRKERLFLFLELNDVPLKEERAKLAFACLLTVVGIPMILAGEEFADEHDRAQTHPDKQKDPLNFDRINDPWRKRLFDYVARLVRFRQTALALSVNDTRVIHTDFTGGRRIVAWTRGDLALHDPVVVVANFSGVQPLGSEYAVPNWPHTPSGRHWQEITQQRDVPNDWIGKEPLFPWEAKVYTLR